MDESQGACRDFGIHPERMGNRRNQHANQTRGGHRKKNTHPDREGRQHIPVPSEHHKPDQQTARAAEKHRRGEFFFHRPDQPSQRGFKASLPLAR